MSLSTHAVELCALLVNETYGELTSRIFTILLRRGRLPVPLLSKHTGLTPRQIRHGLVVLIQQNLVYHHFDQNTGITHYEANHDAAYALVRSGKILDNVNTRHGALARDVVENLFLLGHTKVADLTEAYESKQKLHSNGNGASSTNGANGAGKPSITSTGQLHSILEKLLEAGYLEPVVEIMFLSPTDRHNKTEREVLNDVYGGSTKGIKQKEELKEKVRERIRNSRDQRLWKSNPRKRPLNGESANGVNGSNKRRMLSNGSGAVNGGNDAEDDGTRLDPDLVLRINFEKCTVAIRSQRLVELAKDRVGETTSLVYLEALRLLEEKIPRCRLDPNIDELSDRPDGPTVTTMEISAAIGSSIDVSMGIGKMRGGKIDTKPAHRSKRNRDDESADEDGPERDTAVVKRNGKISNGHHDDPFEDDFEDDIVPAPKRARVTFQASSPEPPEDRENRMLQIKNHLQLLVDDKCGFLYRVGARGQGEWTVDFESLINRMQEEEMDAMILENFGPTGHRLARILKKLGKLDEKQLPNMALIKQKDARTKLAEMQMAGILDIQEVPRDSTHANNRTFFFWFFDGERVAKNLLDNYYKSMSRCLQRLDTERRRAREAIEPTKRSDVWHLEPEEYLSDAQFNDYQKFLGKEEALLGQLGRLDDLVGTFRDF